MVVMVQRGTRGANTQYFGRFPRREGSRTFSSFCGGGAELAPGTYDVVLLHSVGTARVTLRTSLAGHAGFTPAVRSRAVLAPLTAEFVTTNPAGTVVGSHGGQAQLAGQGLILDAGWVHNSSIAALQTAGDCLVSQTPVQVPAPVAYAPGCPAGSSGSSLPGPAGAGQQYISGASINIPGGLYADSVYYVNAGSVQDAGAVAAWVPFTG
jgi:hypothetical protein